MSHIANGFVGKELPDSTREKILTALNDLMSTVGQAQSDNGWVPDAGHLEDLLRARRRREKFFEADLFADPAWDMLLEVFAAELGGRRVSVSSLCIAAAVPPTTALRWISSLTKKGLFIRENDPLDGRRIFIRLSASGLQAMRNYFGTLTPDLAPL